MSVRNGLLALLAEQPMHGYQLKQEFERRTGGTWPLNIGQVYTTVQRLVRDGLVVPVPQGETGATADHQHEHDEEATGHPAHGHDANGHDGPAVERFRLTDAGMVEAAAWWSTPVERGAPARGELAIKLAIAVTVPGVDVADVVQRQRTETLRSLRDFTRLKRETQPAAGAEQAAEDLAWSLVLDHLVFAAEAEVRWLDHVEARVARAARGRASGADGHGGSPGAAGAGRVTRAPSTTSTPGASTTGAPR